ncbi:hypothetical protein HDU85_006607 [Gaertneriomyces sp. JEL0708]|nr:hypothetical protein HDU85_006607 [Gaertneriomyces sp. JEL0708]
MAYEDIKHALTQHLEARGVLSDLRAKVRGEVFRALEGNNESIARPVSRETELVNEVVREYLKAAGYHHTLDVFAAEANLPAKSRGRVPLEDELNVSTDDFPAGVPLLYGLTLANRTVTPEAWADKS